MLHFSASFFMIFLMMVSQQTNAQTIKPWNGKRCAVVLTYDDALNIDLDNVIPCLDSAGLKGTFYLIGDSPVVSSRMAEWRKAALNGHELGNHSLTHPCDGSLPGRTWVSAERDLSRYSTERMVNEIRITNTLLHSIDGKTERTFAFTCGDTKTATGFFYDSLKTEFVGARGVQSGFQTVKEIDLADIRSFGMDGHSAEDMIDLVKKAKETQTLLVFLFHGVGGEHSMNVSLENHRKLVQFLKQHESEIWVGTMVEVAGWVRKR